MTDKTSLPTICPLVSVVIPCYNAEKLVGEAIKSALAQTYPNVEVIVIDDGSTDRSLEVIRSFGPRIRWDSGPNRGGGAARNRGLELAKGGFIQFLDADDLLLPDKIEAQLRTMCGISTNIPCSGRYECKWIGDYEHWNKVDIEPVGTDVLAWVIRATQEIKTSSPLHSKRALNVIGGFDAELPGAQEYDVHIRLAAHGYGFVYDSTPLWVARDVTGSVSSSPKTVFDQHPKIFARAWDLANRNGVCSDEVGQSIGTILMADARWFSLNGFGSRMCQYHKLAKRFDADAYGSFYESNRLLRWIATFSRAAEAERLVRVRRLGFSGLSC